MSIVSFREIDNFQIGPIVRLYVSGSSGSGKTHFVCNLLKKRLFQFSRIYYYHPDFHQSEPTDWHKILSCEVILYIHLRTFNIKIGPQTAEITL